ncbi:MAG TPA: hypothetical protein VFQ33_07620, partial [Xanthobacteraceae bacterium]|nr:hypothetical protein [Xanthobacteraceae bacterium]
TAQITMNFREGPLGSLELELSLSVNPDWWMFWQCSGATFSRCQRTKLPDIAPAILAHPVATRIA